ncbi:MAG: serine/threonine protein kinase [Acidobacteria bacterium]|nr:serine/threonine protein kinase [Acidobacteriota bacterium]
MLGHGGMATVYRASDAELERPVAVKLLAPALSDDVEFRSRFIREARLAARLSHPNVVQVYDAGEDDHRPFIVMEYVAGETLERLLARRRKLPAGEAAALGAQAALGLQHAHDAGLVHRDVKPHNLLLRTDGVLKVADFGIARAAESTRLTSAGTILGTAAYLAPEQALGEEVTSAVDIYAVGAVVYELLSGRPPYEFDSLAELAEKQRAGDIIPVRDLEPSVPDALEAIVMQCLARDARFRPAAAHDVADALAAATGAADVSQLTARTIALPRRTARSVGGHGIWPWVAAAAAIAAVAGALGLSHVGGGGGVTSSPQGPAVRPVAPGSTPAADARNLTRWLRQHSR